MWSAVTRYGIVYWIIDIFLSRSMSIRKTVRHCSRHTNYQYKNKIKINKNNNHDDMTSPADNGTSRLGMTVISDRL